MALPQSASNKMFSFFTRKYWPHNKLKFFLSAFLLLFLPLIVIAAVLGPKIVDNNTRTYAQAADPAVVGQWSEVKNFPIKATHTHLLPNGKVLFSPSFKGGGEPHIWDPTTDSIEQAPNPGWNIFCAGHTLTADGRLFVAGGHIITPQGLPHASLYDPATNTWNRVPDMNAARWYPTTTMLNNGDILTMSGTIDRGVWNDTPQVYDVSENKWRTLSSATRRVSYYPFNYQVGANKVFVAGNHQNSMFLDISGTGKWLNTVKSNFGTRNAGTSVMLEDGRVIIAAGSNGKGNPPTKTAEAINPKATSPKWSYIAPMPVSRRHANSTLLPTGEVLITGGTRGDNDQADLAVKMADIYNPRTNTWKRLSPNTVYRGYHSTALLLPDGRVLTAGGEQSGESYEVYSPPYLFKGPRPTIINAPSQVNYGQTFFVETPDAGSISKVRWIRLGSVTHSFNESQRINSLSFTKTTNGLNVTATANGVITPPGHYMLFILNGKGVPSVAKIIKVGNINSPLPNPPLPSLSPVPTSVAESRYKTDMEILNHEDHNH
jgi:galactose oxidase